MTKARTLADFDPTSVGGISVADTWRRNIVSTYNSGGTFIIGGANWERSDNSRFENVGTGLSYSTADDTFSFPETGKYLIIFQLQGQKRSGANSTYNGLVCQISSDSGSTYENQSTAYQNSYGTDLSYALASNSCIVDVTDTSTFKLRWSVETSNGFLVNGSSTENRTGFTVLRLANT